MGQTEGEIDKIEATSHDNLDVRFLHEQSRVRVKRRLSDIFYRWMSVSSNPIICLSCLCKCDTFLSLLDTTTEAGWSNCLPHGHFITGGIELHAVETMCAGHYVSRNNSHYWNEVTSKTTIL